MATDDTKPKASTKAGGDAGEAEVAQRLNAEQDQGFSGLAVDDTPNENYTVQGQAAGKPTPETEAGPGGKDVPPEPKA